MPFSRRALLQATAAVSALAAFTKPARALAAFDTTPTLTLHTGEPIAALPANFTGLGYEMSSAARLGLLSTANKPYLQLVRNLGPSGVLRLGGIVADYSTYAPQGTVRTDPKNTVVTRASLQQLRAFLDACGWSAIWSVNFGHGTLSDALAEARDVAAILGPRLLALELGNEVENYAKGNDPRRSSPWTYDIWRAEYTRWRTTLLDAVPDLRFAAPDTAASIDWLERLAADAHGDVQLLTTHYYRGDQHKGTQDQLLTPDANLAANLLRLHRASGQSGLPWRMCETNSFFGGGRPGVSNTLTGALWTLDFMLLLAQNGCSGVNIETGVNQLGFISSYSPIQDDNAGGNTAGVPYYGMLAFALAARGATQILSTTLHPAAENVAAYALSNPQQLLSVVLMNKSTNQTAHLSLGALNLGQATAYRLTGPSPDSQSGITLAGAAVDAAGTWSPASPEAVHTEMNLSPASALILRAQ